MSQSTDIVRPATPVQDVTDTRRVEAHAIATQTHLTLAAAMVEVYARTEGLPLAPIDYWFFSTSGQPTLNGSLARSRRSPVHEQRQQLRDWADALGADVTETRGYDSKAKLTAMCLIGGVPVSVQTEVDHNCTCTGQCNGSNR